MKRTKNYNKDPQVNGGENEGLITSKIEVKGSILAAKKKEKIFLFFFLLYPVCQALFFFFAINFNSLLLAFKEYVPSEGKIMFTGNLFVNFERVFNEIFVSGELLLAVKNSAILLVIMTIIATPIHIAVAYSIFRNIPFSGFYKIMLFLPSMVSCMVFVISYRTLIVEALPIIIDTKGINILDEHNASSFWTVTVFGFWLEFSSGLVVYLSAMAGIPVDVIEYGKLENLSSIKELWYVVIPLIFSTITTYIVVGVTKFFTYQGFFFSFFGAHLDVTPFDTLGYVFFARVVGADAGVRNYPYASAAGLMFTCVIGPLTMFTKYLLEKYGPSEE